MEMDHGRDEVRVRARIKRIDRFGLCEVISNENRPTGAAFTLDQVFGYGGQPLREFGIEERAEVELVEDETGRVDHVHVVNGATAA